MAREWSVYAEHTVGQLNVENLTALRLNFRTSIGHRHRIRFSSSAMEMIMARSPVRNPFATSVLFITLVYTAFIVPGPARDVEIEFLTTGNVSASSNESLATVYYPGDVRATIPAPYAVPLGPAAGDVNINGTLV